MKETGQIPEKEPCGSAALFRGVLLLQEKWTLLIVNRLLQGSIGFNELCRKADGVNPTTMSQRLAMLEGAGLVEKTIHSTMPPRTSYELTQAGREIEPILKEIEKWSLKNLPETPATEKCRDVICSESE
ncbi:MAG TPA: helix-turn-helix domain-containing protein [Fimbriimonas sp.]|nr:helix-turn-helix domain-containing protein [Fimbriimonas sp.]